MVLTMCMLTSCKSSAEREYERAKAKAEQSHKEFEKSKQELENFEKDYEEWKALYDKAQANK